MDPTLLAALAGILGAVIGSILGGVFREHVATCAGWYADDFLRLLPVEAGEALAQKTSAQSEG